MRIGVMQVLFMQLPPNPFCAIFHLCKFSLEPKSAYLENPLYFEIMGSLQPGTYVIMFLLFVSQFQEVFT